MINKKNVLGKRPAELGVKDAIHTAIVSVRAGAPIKPGERCGLNEFNEAVPNRKGPGVADPFVDGPLARGSNFWLLLDQDEVPNVRHEWEHPSVDFSPPKREVKRNKYLLEYADKLGVTYEQLMDACSKVVQTEDPTPYPGIKSAEEVKEVQKTLYDLWYEWSDETGYEFENIGTACCPEYQYPECKLFQLQETGTT